MRCPNCSKTITELPCTYCGYGKKVEKASVDGTL